MSEHKSDNINSSSSTQTDVNYWRSFEDLYKNPELIEARNHEFKNGTTDDFDPLQLSSISRRKFLALLGASAALAGTACTDYRDKGEIVPYNVKPEEITIGKPNFYASTCTVCPNACGILIRTREGRPIKVDGNPEHPVNKGKICAKGQANILNLYDPERLSVPLKKDDTRFDEISWKEADNYIIKVLNEADDKEIVIITHTITSPTTLNVLEKFQQKYPATKIYSYELFNDSIKNSAWQKCYDSRNYPLLKWNEARVIVSLESDFLGVENNRIETARLFTEGRNVDTKKFNRLYVIESNLSLTGLNSDYRLRLRPDAQYEFVMSMINELKNKGAINITANTSSFSLNSFALKYNLKKETLNQLVTDLISNKGKAIIDAGNSLPENVHIAVNLLNAALGNSNLYRTDAAKNDLLKLSSIKNIEELVSQMNDGKVAAVIHFDCNPVYHFAKDLGYEDALKKVGAIISLTEKESETSFVSNYVLPINHNFEAWGDAQPRKNIISLQQPVIAPLKNTRQKEAILLTWIDGEAEAFSEKLYYDYLMKNWETSIYPTLNSVLDFKQFWLGALHDGIIYTNEITNNPTAINSDAVTFVKDEISKTPEGYTIVLKESYQIGDGRLAGNGWLQELPHPISKITWDNYAAVSEKTCKALGVKNNDVVEVIIEGRKISLPVFMQAGTADNVISIELGYGREHSGTVASGVGFNANILLSKNNIHSPLIYSNVSINKTGDIYELASSQEHHSFDDERTKDLAQKRHIIQEGTVAGYIKNPKFIKEKQHENLQSVYEPHQYNGVKWGMAIDLNKCTGCGDCVAACNVENNIPIVGKDQVLKSREMQWLRIDRYYSGTADDPNVSIQPMLCQHCDQAPCENVCPVAATSHSPDGLNQMVYNRCVGTRYCSNNCPYKVRRFNFFNFRDHFKNAYQESPIFALMQNPEVTVRSRGVMEKCTFCVQRISEAKAEATHNQRPLKGSDVTTACQDTCSTNAIYFGDINNKESEFYKYRNHELGYYVLEELNIKPNVTYIAKLRNINLEEV
jgi:molybdopterin-containing oxidoreductase family iron-sulfur binding subunit